MIILMLWRCRHLLQALHLPHHHNLMASSLRIFSSSRYYGLCIQLMIWTRFFSMAHYLGVNKISEAFLAQTMLLEQGVTGRDITSLGSVRVFGFYTVPGSRWNGFCSECGLRGASFHLDHSLGCINKEQTNRRASDNQDRS